MDFGNTFLHAKNLELRTVFWGPSAMMDCLPASSIALPIFLPTILVELHAVGLDLDRLIFCLQQHLSASDFEIDE